MEELGIEVPPFILNRFVRVQHTKQSLTGTSPFTSSLGRQLHSLILWLLSM